VIPGFTSTGSKRPLNLFGTDVGVPTRMRRAEGCRLWDEEGREYIDFIMVEYLFHWSGITAVEIIEVHLGNHPARHFLFRPLHESLLV